ncbi:hypothetical protein GWK08_03520 [Leptobacterium flavescens]|uniref:Uncharacterized protein n=1 Tax=Leptobacterium flavescens TaxID=472055 RepID=A0A6P0UQ33_9FLAO|nr:hypothetical protein [Leptobacterium flavescens]NER12496.1 hypothetical protein [Leptobacterium flavescens]
MAPNNLENQMKEKLSDRKIIPSDKAWMSIREELDKKNGKRNFRPFYWAIAACFVGLIVIFSYQTGSGKTEELQIQVVEDKVDEKEVLQKEITPVPEEQEQQETRIAVTEDKKEPVSRKKVQEPETAAQTNMIPDAPVTLLAEEIAEAETKAEVAPREKAIPLKITEEQLIENKIAEVVSKIADLQKKDKEVSDEYIESLLAEAQKEIDSQRTSIYKSGKIDATALLLDVEDELYRSFKDRVFEAIRNGFKKTKTAVAERNH